MGSPVSDDDDARWRLLAILTTSYGAGAFGMLGISPLSPSLVGAAASGFCLGSRERRGGGGGGAPGPGARPGAGGAAPPPPPPPRRPAPAPPAAPPPPPPPPPPP